MSKRKSLNAFTVLELVAVVAMLSILIILAYANYGKPLRYNHVALVKAYLLDVSNRQDRYLQQYQIYAQDLEQLGMTPNKMLASHYRVMLVDVQNSPNPIGYIVKAVPKIASEEDTAGTFSLNHLGQTSDNWNP